MGNIPILSSGGLIRQPKFPCQVCTERTVGCHSSCERYISVKAAYDAEKAENKKVKDQHIAWIDYHMPQVIKTKKRRGSQS